ncbi:MAG: hypothetical protein EWV53_12310 [Microcystis panniformis Mp_MB_F_20051200_S9]|uniref:Uncharacterized protein n=1 Tax=Microcystis panniformis Mp_MB_F_20051200_S9 TaxID=2486223 RepID=A0A552PX75_9CHRO|nr:MAG: hypothetical protein EWV43_19490 [Microcystis panniformis Mp_MB_F_20080800_S26D]TRV48061.1 MAG: hypothetical protein EWV87_13020 [Microcystis panniformis Mp_GB_SS_20050300_S99]TRV51986.1 MAG: hypothetical protein EWV42_08710 [Microcystis panniformis Mp_GB_SS_20050300_S99D]TRV53978.1 MAG: hypothetical protein EWV69_23085 [Microcystis panniformis Mp_MB_F_20080800_S26]TRV60231.1 MAG: hypothetical protein EWV86_16740 [Microcystis panniformis Mp_MB_F_20051200_S9D]TRV61561.1 MAG: hypothetica
MNNLITTREASDWFGVGIKPLQPWQKQAKISSILSPSEPSMKVDNRLSKVGQLYANKFS